MQLFTTDPPDVPTARVRLTGGSFGLQKYQVSGGGSTEHAGLFLSGSFFGQDGFRDHSTTESGTIGGKLHYTLGTGTDVTLLLAAVDSPTAEDPGGITRAAADTRPEAARALNVRLRADESVQQGRLGVVVRQQLAAGSLEGYAYGLYRDDFHRTPDGWLFARRRYASLGRNDGGIFTPFAFPGAKGPESGT